MAKTEISETHHTSDIEQLTTKKKTLLGSRYIKVVLHFLITVIM